MFLQQRKLPNSTTDLAPLTVSGAAAASELLAQNAEAFKPIGAQVQALGDSLFRQFEKQIQSMQQQTLAIACQNLPSAKNFTERAVLVYLRCIEAHRNGVGLIPTIPMIAKALGCKKQPVVLARLRLPEAATRNLRTFGPQSGKRCLEVQIWDVHSGRMRLIRKRDLVINDIQHYVAGLLRQSVSSDLFPTQSQIAKHFSCALRFVAAAKRKLSPELQEKWLQIVTKRRIVIRPRTDSQRQRGLRLLRGLLDRFETAGVAIPCYEQAAKDEGISYFSLHRSISLLGKDAAERLREAYRQSRARERDFQLPPAPSPCPTRRAPKSRTAPAKQSLRKATAVKEPVTPATERKKPSRPKIAPRPKVTGAPKMKRARVVAHTPIDQAASEALVLPARPASIDRLNQALQREKRPGPSLPEFLPANESAIVAAYCKEHLPRRIRTFMRKYSIPNSRGMQQELFNQAQARLQVRIATFNPARGALLPYLHTCALQGIVDFLRQENPDGLSRTARKQQKLLDQKVDQMLQRSPAQPRQQLEEIAAQELRLSGGIQGFRLRIAIRAPQSLSSSQTNWGKATHVRRDAVVSNRSSPVPEVATKDLAHAYQRLIAHTLGSRYVAVLHELIQGSSAKDIGASLGVSPFWVWKMRKQIQQVLRSAADAIDLPKSLRRSKPDSDDVTE